VSKAKRPNADRAAPSAPARPARQASRVALGAWTLVCLALAAMLVATRALRYSGWTDGPQLDGLFRELMVFDTQAFIWPWVYTTLKLRILVIAALVLILGFHRRLLQRIVVRDDGVWRLTPIAVSLLLGGVLWLQYLLDLNPTTGAFCLASIALAALTERPGVARTVPRGALALGWTALFGWWLAIAPDATERAGVVAWAAVLAATHAVAAGTRAGDRALLRLAAMVPTNLVPAVLPLVIPLHGGTLLGPGVAYGFCEVPGRGTVYATIPRCESVQTTYDDCGDGSVVEYDLRSMTRVAEHRYFSPRFYGRLELIECLDDEVQVAVQGAMVEGRAAVHTALAFPVAAPETFNPVAAREGVGLNIAYDAARDALFYTGEFTHRVVRYDRRTDRLADVPVPELAREWVQPILLQTHSGSSIVYTNSIHPGRNRMYVAEWIQGRYAYAIDLETLRVVQRYEVGGGGALGITVDPERDRLLVSSVWGLEVFDLATDALIARRRMGLGNRPVIVDRARNRLYSGSAVDGKIRIFDRDTLEPIAEIPVGLGTRFAYLSRDGTYLFATSATAHYYWEASALAPRR
jgi:hypothetical protein